MPNPQLHSEPPQGGDVLDLPRGEITEDDIEFEELIETELRVLGTSTAEEAAERLAQLDAIEEDSNERERLAERLIGEERQDAIDGDDGDDVELEEPDDDGEDEDHNVDDSPSEDGADDEWPEQEEHGWDLYDETEVDL